MSDRYVTLTVFLEEPIKEEDAEYIMKAIQMVRGVRAVEPACIAAAVSWAKESAKDELRQKLFDVLYSAYTPRR